jgi:alkylation response protein AidB-like acyl-CoA dehydrogenase
VSEPTIIENKNRNEAEHASIAVAEASRELDWKSKSFVASLFMGELDLSSCFPFPAQSEDDRRIGDEICARVDAFCQEQLDGELVDRNQEIPAHVLRGLAELGLFGMKIPKKYGGLGLSQTNYLRVLCTVSRHCASTGATLSAHQSIGVPQPLKHFGTEEQKQKYLPLLASGWVSAFGLTEPGVGSDPANMTTTARLSEDGKHWILNGYKLWCTNGTIADLLVVMAKTGSDKKGSREVNRISAFIVETRWAGVDVVHRSRFMGLRAIENGVIRFQDVQVPAENLLWGEGKGLRLALTTLNDGRLGIPAIAATGLRNVADYSARWGKSRHQWGKLIGEHEAGAEKLAHLAAGSYAMECMAQFGAALSDRGDVDIRMEAAAAKLFNTELGYTLIDEALQFRGGRGYETATSITARGEWAVPLERAMRDARINRIVEGTTDIMHLFLAREALDKHLSLAGALFNPRATAGDKGKAVARAAAFYATWYPKLWIGGIFKSFDGFRGELKSHVRWVERRTRKLARTLFHLMAVHGPKLEMKQLQLARIVDIGVELAVMGLVASRAQGAATRGDLFELDSANFWLRWARVRVDDLFARIRHNQDAAARKLAKAMMERVDPLPQPQPMSDLKPQPREWGSDLTSGRQEKRRSEGGVVRDEKRKVVGI